MKTKYLKKCAISNSLKGLVEIPFALIISEFISKIIFYAGDGNIDKVKNRSLQLIIFIISCQVLIFIINMLSQREIEKAGQKFREHVYSCFLNNSFNASKSTGEIIVNFTKDVDEVIKLYSKSYSSCLVNCITTASYLLFIGINHIGLSVVVLLISLIQAIPPIIVKKFMVKNYDATMDIEGQITDYIVEGYRGAATIKLFNLYELYLKGLKKLHSTYLKVGRKSELAAQTQNSMESAVDIILRFGTYSLIGFFLLQNVITLDAGAKAIVLAGSLYAAVNGIFMAIPEIYVAKKAKDRLQLLIMKDKKNYEKLKSIINKPLEATILEVDNLSFGYENNIILKNISFSIKKGDLVVISGANGSGKSTLLNILMGFYKNYSGHVFFNGMDLRSLDLDKYYKSISCNFQEERGFSKSLNELLDILDQGQVLRKKEVFGYGKNFKLTDELINNERINKLSGGEKKKIYLIISLLKQHKILFLDEPSNSLDIGGKNVLKDILKHSKSTIVMITHDPYFMDICNLKINLCEGEVTVERGKN